MHYLLGVDDWDIGIGVLWLILVGFFVAAAVQRHRRLKEEMPPPADGRPQVNLKGWGTPLPLGAAPYDWESQCPELK